ncbi:ATP-grasp domain-containing protein [Halanaerobacter jeridensis]|uniref:ATP-grasp domain-containing protein n=1 Tax=Halanaerobacter jeridensis TaxID=706427 RepID=UPI00195CBA87|nr:ATP-grasp domain-containing protein [Halanaerobacter jeridensis]
MMIVLILDKPYVSEFLEDTILELNLPVLKNKAAKEFKLNEDINFLEEKEFVNKVKNEESLIYSNSENPINWITNHLSFTDLPEKIDIFKDKYQFRKLLRDMYPDFYFRKVSFDELDQIDINEVKIPFIIKPSVGFFSMGVYQVNSALEWEKVRGELKKEVNNMKDNYPEEVINTNEFIIEENIEGKEFAIDLYYNDEGKPVILNILEHIFSSGEDVNDRVYITSKKIIEKYHNSFLDFLNEMGALINLNGFPMHIEFRVDNDENIVPIEVNPMRFAGWCTTDVAYHAYGINVYEYFFKQKEPNWEKILKIKKDKIYSIVVADLPNDINVNDIIEINYDKFSSYFENTLEMRKIDYNKYGVFAFLFAETSYDNWGELETILKSDLREYLKFKH